MRITKKETLFEGKFIRVVAKHFETEKGYRGVWETVERRLPQKRAVVIFALTKQKEVVLERIYRVPLEAYVLEPPAGLCDKEGESDEEAARRELLEETGYKAEKIVHIFTCTGDMTLTDLEIVYFFAPDVEYTGKTENDDAEEIEVSLVPVEKLIDTALNPPANTKIAFDLLSILPILQQKGLA